MQNPKDFRDWGGGVVADVICAYTRMEQTILAGYPLIGTEHLDFPLSRCPSVLIYAQITLTAAAPPPSQKSLRRRVGVLTVAWLSSSPLSLFSPLLGLLAPRRLLQYATKDWYGGCSSERDGGDDGGS